MASSSTQSDTSKSIGSRLKMCRDRPYAMRAIYTLMTMICVLTGASVWHVAHEGNTISLDYGPFYPLVFPNATQPPLSKNSSPTMNSPRILHQYKLSEQLRLSICGEKNHTIIDIRQFLDGKPTIKGINIPLGAFKMLQLFWRAIIHDLENTQL